MKWRNGAAWGIAWTWVFFSAAAVSAQAPGTVPFEYATTPAVSTTPPEAGPLFATPPGAAQECPATGWGASLLLGLPSGLRLQKALSPDPNQTALLEGFAGLFLIFPSAGGGVRYRFTPLAGKTDTLYLSPGVDGYVIANPFAFGSRDNWFRGLGLVSVDVDMAWQHSFGRHTDGEFGVKLGAAASVGRLSGVVPIVGVFGGFRY
jgi:hypothetical protein